MRKITQAIIEAIRSKEKLSQSNTIIQYSLTHEMSIVYLHGHEIAKIYHDRNEVHINFCGYATNTTRDRINAILEAMNFEDRFKIKDGEPMLVKNSVPASANKTIVFRKA